MPPSPLVPRDAMFGWHTWVWARLQAKTGKSKVFFNCFDPHPEYQAGSPRAGYGSGHGAGVPVWPAFSDANPTLMHFAQTPHTDPVPGADALRVLDQYFAWRRTPEGEAFVK